eukprot:evm.model.scf_342.5 EVM.evm.TU.scf_342.5   scf_342:75505-80732(+)
MGYWSKFRSKAFVAKAVDEGGGKEDGGEDGAGLRKVLSAFDLVMIGVGGILGAGVFVLTGVASSKYAGPSVVLSYAVASLAALFSALCYAEFAVDLPVAGSAYNYISLVFGEFPAWIAAINLIMEYCLSSSTIAKGFTSYFGSLLRFGSGALTINLGDRDIFNLDILAFVLILGLSILLSLGIKASSLFNNVVSGINLLAILFVLCASTPFFRPANFVPFVPFGIKGMIRAASIVFFTYIGFDCVATVAEEVRNPTRDLPIGIVGSLSIVTALYVAMAVAITGLQSYNEIDVNAPFATAFNSFGMRWASEIVSIGAITGIVACLMVTLMGMARIFMVLGRERLLPEWMAKVHNKHKTPLNATIVTGIVSGLPALFLNIDFLAKMVSMGTLFVLCMVNVGVVWRRYFQPFQSTSCKPVIWRLAVMITASIVEGLVLEQDLPIWVWGASIGKLLRLAALCVPRLGSQDLAIFFLLQLHVGCGQCLGRKCVFEQADSAYLAEMVTVF